MNGNAMLQSKLKAVNEKINWLGVGKSESREDRESGCPKDPKSESPEVRKSGRPGVRMSERPEVRKNGSPEVRGRGDRKPRNWEVGEAEGIIYFRHL